ncbi:hypothetical protein M0813_24630 [Anaeramoeba flamelloides]|uniref:Uncharacterized protein n=1 Tax=Anaeramoeba flamelloides TaxID=1746091 RepID=A0ABQ8Y5V4_9EUKA|nr:hypothetical protein M0813_24630 [Anaeramoeba flamelloides]
MNLKTPTKLKNEDDPLIMEVSLALVSLKEKCLFENRFQNISRQYPVYIPFIPFYGNYQFNYPEQHYSSTQNESQEGLTSECLKNIEEKASPQTTRVAENQKRQEKTLSFEELNQFLHTKPRPTWSSRLECFYRYDNNLILGWKTGFADLILHTLPEEKPKKVIISKRLFTIFSNLTKVSNSKKDYLRVYKSSQRGVEEFFKKVGYHKIANYSRDQVVFAINI